MTSKEPGASLHFFHELFFNLSGSVVVSDFGSFMVFSNIGSNFLLEMEWILWVPSNSNDDSIT